MLKMNTESSNTYDLSVSVRLDAQEKCRKSNPVVREIDKHLNNLREILLHTNATPIRCYDGYGYGCSFCSVKSFFNPADLKSHTLSEHTELEKTKYKRRSQLARFAVRLDVTSLQCLLCLDYINSLEDVMTHLMQEHGRKLFTDINSHLIPFSFNEEPFTCVVCAKIFTSFKILSEHMNLHYGTYMCGICNSSFLNERGLKLHMKRHKQGVFECPQCPKTFDTSYKRYYHIKCTHLGVQKRNKCRICLEMFATHQIKLDHMVTVHGCAPLIYKCLACEKTFVSRVKMTDHTRTYHLMERRYECKLCEKKFVRSKGLKEHVLKHTGVPEFRCDLCKKLYWRKYTLREHMRIHADDRRFKCEICGQTFVQKCSWKGHMRSKHAQMV